MATVRADPYDVTLVPVARFADATPVNVVVLSGADATYLVDAGAGPVGHWGPCPGLPEPVLAALGITRLSGLIVTHWDWDHCGGLVDGPWGGPLVPRFPEIPVHVLDEELAFWRARSDGEEAANCGTAVLAVLESAGLLRPVRDGDW